MSDYLEASLVEVRPCAARSDYVELVFRTSCGTWEWCFPAPERGRRRPLRPLILRMGTYGVQAHLERDDGLGLAVPSGAALRMIIAGAPVRVQRRLLRTSA